MQARTDNPKSSTLLSLIAVILSAGAFKEELKTIVLWEGSWNLLEIFIGFALFYGFLFAMYLLIEASEGVPGFKHIAAAKRFTYILDFLFLSSVLSVVTFSLLAIVLSLLSIPIVLELAVKLAVFIPAGIAIIYNFIGLKHELVELGATRAKLSEIKGRLREEDENITSR